jgi:hypothetical protein
MDCYKQFKQISVVLNIMALSQLEYKQITFADWGRIGLKIITNSCNALRVLPEFGLLIRWFRVRASGYPDLRIYPNFHGCQVLTCKSGSGWKLVIFDNL